MKIKIEMEIRGCWECPFKEHYYEHGYNAYECTKIKSYPIIAKEGFLPKCPFLKKDVDNSQT